MFGKQQLKKEITFVVDVVVEPDEGQFHAWIPALKGLHVGGDTEAEAIENARDAAIAYVRSLVKHGDPIPMSVVVESEAPKSDLHVGLHTHEQKLELCLT